VVTASCWVRQRGATGMTRANQALSDQALGPVSKGSTSCQAPNAVARGVRARHGKCFWTHRQRVDELDGPDPLAKETLP
jgi:hypothetical protein